MLYILPPLRGQNSSTTWGGVGGGNLICGDSTTSGNTTNTRDNRDNVLKEENLAWKNDSNRNRPPKIRLKNLQIFHRKDDDAATAQDNLDSNRNSKSLNECYFAGKGTALVLLDADATTQLHSDNVDFVKSAAAVENCQNDIISPASLSLTVAATTAATSSSSTPPSSVSSLTTTSSSSPSVSSSLASKIKDGENDTEQNSSAIQRHLQSMFYLLRAEETLKMAVKLESIHPFRTRYLVVVSRIGGRGEESCLLGIDCNAQTTVGLVLRVLANTTITLDGDGGFSVSVCDSHHIFKPVSVQAMWSALQTLYKISAKAHEGNYFQGGGTHNWAEHYESNVTSDRSCLNEWHAMDCLESRRPPSPDSIRARPTEREETEKVIRSTLKEIMMSVDLDEVTSKVIRSRLEEQLDMDLGEYKSFIDQEMLVILGQMDAPTEIFDHVYLGSEWNASNYDELTRNGVGHILNVTREIDNFFPGTFDYLNVRVYDDEKTDLLKYLDDTFKYISKARNDGSKVLVHCKMGVSRSASVVIAYAMKAYDWDFYKALTYVKKKRNCIKPNTNFLTQLETYQGMLDAMKNKEKLQRSKSETNLKSPIESSQSEKQQLQDKQPHEHKHQHHQWQRPTTTIIQSTMSKSYDRQSTLSGQNLRQMSVRPKSWSPDNLTTRGIHETMKSSPGFISLEDLSQVASLARHMLIPCDNGESYSVSPNQIVHLPGHDNNNSLIGTGSGHDGLIDTNNSSCKLSERKTATWDPGEYFFNQQQTVNSSNNNSTNSSEICDQKLSNENILTNNENSNMCFSSLPVWTSSSVVVSQCAVRLTDNLSNVPELRSKNLQQFSGDLFSNQLDRVFDKEEKRQKRKSITAIVVQKQHQQQKENVPIIIDDSHLQLQQQSSIRDCPSRQSSWSSYDSAVVINFPEKNELSRHSSWGSDDTRTLPSRNSSWGSYDLRPRSTIYYNNEKGEKTLHTAIDLDRTSSGVFPYDKGDIPWQPGTVKRTKQRLERGTVRQLSNDSSITSSNLSLTKTSSSETFAETVNEQFINTIERTKTPLIAEPSGDDNDCCVAISDDTIPIENSQRLSISAPESSTMELVSQKQHQEHVLLLSYSASSIIMKNLKQQHQQQTGLSNKQPRIFLENFHKDGKKIDSNAKAVSQIGKVQNLKKEFEAKSAYLEPAAVGCTVSSIVPTSTNTICELIINKQHHNRVNSMLTSPILVHHSTTNKELQNEKIDDLNLKSLISVFENNKADVRLRDAKNSTINSNRTNRNRYSCSDSCGTIVENNPSSSLSSSPSVQPIIQTPLICNLDHKQEKLETDYKKPPIGGKTEKQLAATVIATAMKKRQQYGHNHPLAKLNIRSRHNNPVYNTM